MSGYEDYRAEALSDLATALGLPLERIGRSTSPELPCFCGPETRAAHTHARNCPRWIRLSEATE